jgi:hypothetical protein
MKDNRPHWWKAPPGGSASGSEVTPGKHGYTDEELRKMDPRDYRKLRESGAIR